MTSSDQLVELVEEFVDKRTNFGQEAIARAARLAGPQVEASYELISRIKSKGITKINNPLQFRLVGYEKGEKHERIGQSIANPKLRTVFRYSISATGTTGDARSGQVAGVGAVGNLGEIEVGKILNEKLPILIPILGDDRYREFFQQQGRNNRNREATQNQIRTMQDVIAEQLADCGFDTTELSGYLKDYFNQAARTDSGNDLLWLGRQIETGKINDDNLSFAFYDVMLNIDYSNESAQLTSHAVMELRKRSAKGLIGKLKDDLLFLDKNKGIHNVNLNQPFRRRIYYPEKKSVEEGTIRKKLNQNQLSFSEALGIVRHFPGIVQAKKRFNRTNAETYFGEGQRAVAGVTKALEHVRQYLEKDKEAYHKAKQRNSTANLKLGKGYRLAKKLDELAALDKTKGDFANLAYFTGFKDSRDSFSGLYTLDNQLALAESCEDAKVRAGANTCALRVSKAQEVESGRVSRDKDSVLKFTGVMASKYVNDVDFEEEHRLSLKEFIKRFNDVNEILLEPSASAKKKSAQRKAIIIRKRDKQYERFRENLERLSHDAEFNLVSVDFQSQLTRYTPVLKEYKENKGSNKKGLDKLIKFANVFDLTDLTTDHDFRPYGNRAYLSDSEIQEFQSVRKRLHSVADFKRVRLEDIPRYETLKKEVEEKLGKSGSEKLAYDCKRGSLRPSPRVFLSTYSKKEDFTYLNPKELKSKAKFVDKCKTSQELGEEFLSKLQAISENSNQRNLKSNRYYKVNKPVLDRLIDQYQSKPKGILLTNDFIAEVERCYEKLEK